MNPDFYKTLGLLIIQYLLDHSAILTITMQIEPPCNKARSLKIWLEFMEFNEFRIFKNVTAPSILTILTFLTSETGISKFRLEFQEFDEYRFL